VVDDFKRAGRGIVLRILDAHTGTLLRELKGHAGVVTRVAFTPDGQRLATASQDGTVKIWTCRPAESC